MLIPLPNYVNVHGNYTKYAVCDCTWPLLKKLYKGRELLNMLTDVQKYSHYIRGGICERRETI